MTPRSGTGLWDVSEGQGLEHEFRQRVVGLLDVCSTEGAVFAAPQALKNLMPLWQVTDSNGRIILFIDEIHTVVGAGASEGSMDAGTKPCMPHWQRKRLFQGTRSRTQWGARLAAVLRQDVTLRLGRSVAQRHETFDSRTEQMERIWAARLLRKAPASHMQCVPACHAEGETLAQATS